MDLSVLPLLWFRILDTLQVRPNSGGHMDENNNLGTQTVVCPVCHESIEIPTHMIDDDGNYSVQCMKCKIPVTGKAQRPRGTL